jgi:hypothetical protein
MRLSKLKSAECEERSAERAFTLLEVIIACALFFMFAFAVLELVTRGLNAARAIQVHEPDAALVLGPFSTNKTFEVGTQTGDFEELYPGVYPGYTWTMDVAQPFGETNPLYQVTVAVTGKVGKRRTTESIMSVLMYGADSNIRPGAGTFAAPPR